MTASYRWVQWNRHKLVYDALLVTGCVLYLAVFVGVGLAVHGGESVLDPMILLMRAFSTLAFVLLHIVLCIGPLARLSDLFAPLLYNRRHLGVTLFVAAVLHSGLALLYYGGFGVRHPLSGVVDGYHSFGSLSGFPFEVLGLIALLVLFAMAATSHDFWLSFLGPRTWKTLHMGVYGAYALVVLHVALGILQAEPSGVYPVMLLGGVGIVGALHIAASLRPSKVVEGRSDAQGWADIGEVDDFPLDQGRVVELPSRQQVAVFRHADGLSAMSNVCAHQGGPLGEGVIIDGCATCPWHGYQYRPEDGCSPPPYTEKLPTYELRCEGSRVLIRTEPLQPGTHIQPARPPSSNAEAPTGEHA